MNLKIASRQAARSAAIALTSPCPRISTSCITSRRTYFDIKLWGKKGNSDQAADNRKPLNPLTEEYLRKKPAAAPGAPVRGDLSSSSIFEDEEIAGPKPTRENVAAEDIPRNPDTMAAALDPDPMSRKRWERKMVIRDITKRGRLTRAQLLKKEERVVQIRSHDFKTSVKKLLPLAKQITGKTVEDAIIQMRFSKKKAAKDVKEHLEYTKNQAIVRRGMGLGVGVEEGKFHPKQIMTKHGKRIKVTDPTRMYVDQAWVGRGPFGRTPEFRKGGRVNIMMNPWTSLTLVLKEEKTRIRLHEEREAKEARRKVWVQLPNRPITAQRQYYSW